MATPQRNTNCNNLKLTYPLLVIFLVLVYNHVVAAAASSPKNPTDTMNPVQNPTHLYPRGRYHSQQPQHSSGGLNGSPSSNNGNTNSDSSSDTSEHSTGSGSDVPRGPNGNGSHSSGSTSVASSASSQTPQSSSSTPTIRTGKHLGTTTTTVSAGNSSLSSDLGFQSTGTATSSGPLCTEKTGCRRGFGEDIRKISLQMIRLDILKKLRMNEDSLPNVTSKGFPIPPGYITEFIDMPNDSPRDDYDDEHATTEKIIAFSRIQQLKISQKETRGVYYFTFSDKLSNMKVEKALLYIHVRTAHQTFPHQHQPYNEKKFFNFTIRLMEFVPQKKGESPLSINYGYFKPTIRSAGEGHGSGHGHGRHSRSKWVQIDVRDALTKWLAGTAPSASKRIGLVIEAIDPNGQDVSQDVTIVSSNEMDVNSNPFIEVHVSDKGKSRPPRNIGMTCDENSQETRCCRYPLTVDFEDFGWDWIIAPKKYDANYCSGECPYAFLQKYPHNHIVQQAIPTGVGGPCCAARKMSSISMLYFDSDSNIVFSVLPGMVVDKCGCS